MKIYVINLERSPERRRFMEQQLTSMGTPFEIVPAVDGRTLDMSNRAIVDPALPSVVLQRTGGSPEGVAGCALSHARAYGRILETTDKSAVILEDDAALPKDFPELIASVEQAMGDAEIALLHYANRQGCRVTRRGATDIGRSRLLATPVTDCHLTSSAAYIITRQACRSLLEGAVPVRTYPDDWETFREQGMIQRVRCVVPMAVLHSPDFRTTIDYWKPGSFRERLGARIQQAELPIINRLLSLRRAHEAKGRGWRPHVTFVDGVGHDAPLCEDHAGSFGVETHAARVNPCEPAL